MSLDLGWSQIPEDIVAISNILDDYFQWDNSLSPPRGYEHYHPSAFGHCLRQMQYYRYAEMGLMPLSKNEAESRTIRVWQMGHWVHKRWSHYFEQMGVLRGVWQCTNPLCNLIQTKDGKIITNSIRYDDIQKFLARPLHQTNESNEQIFNTRVYGLDEKKGIFKPERCLCGHNHFQYHEVLVEDKEMNFKGHADLILDFNRLNKNIKIDKCNIDQLPKEPFVVDIKSTNEYDYKQKICKFGPHLEYQIQLCIYTNILDCPFGLLLYENKNDSSVRMFKIERSSETMFQNIKRQAIRMGAMVEFQRLPPPRPFSKDEFECSRCQFSSLCHASPIWDDDDLNDKRIRFYGNLLHS